MALISAYTIIRALSFFHMALAYFFLTSPKLIADQNVVFLLGESMQLPTPREFNKPSAATAFIAVLFAFLAITDLTALSLSEEFGEAYWGTQTPVRLSFLFAVTGYTYMFKEGGMFAKRTAGHSIASGGDLKNSIVFTWGFLELACWFWVFVNLRDERRQRAMRLIEKRKAENDSL
ncbi:increased loss of mitochondrial DNA protein 1 [Clohesyomyces aquaticus]|uniref:Increased loss of mitochondrial DNA protein 1 n=1 Tax=Clohesyomyces aquaticus TaxID=1231657 RepID=A0A1Y1Y0T9_9PLEO|nr:increased loss of mitochondrial DNA protein 1 [Clohesyomyces aquaticus]